MSDDNVKLEGSLTPAQWREIERNMSNDAATANEARRVLAEHEAKQNPLKLPWSCRLQVPLDSDLTETWMIEFGHPSGWFASGLTERQAKLIAAAPRLAESLKEATDPGWMERCVTHGECGRVLWARKLLKEIGWPAP